MNEEKKHIKDLLGYGVRAEFVTGLGDDGEPKVEAFHFTPAPLKDLPELQECLNEFFEASDKNQWTEESINKAAKVAIISLRKMHSDITLDDIKEKFGLGGLAKAIKCALDVNNFLSEMGEIKEALPQDQIPNPAKKKKA